MRLHLRHRPKLIGVARVCLALISAAFSGCSSAPKRESNATLLPLSPSEDAKLEQRVEALAHYATGISQELNNMPSEATDEFLKAALADIQEQGLVQEVARRLIREKKNHEAIELLQKASAETTASPSTYALLGLAYMQAGETNLAIQANQLSIKNAPENLAGYQNLAAL